MSDDQITQEIKHICYNVKIRKAVRQPWKKSIFDYTCNAKITQREGQ